MKILDDIKDLLIFQKEFNKTAIKLVRFNSSYDVVYAQHDKENLTFRFFKELNLKRNDKLIDEHDNIYFIEEVAINQPFKIKVDGLLAEEKEFKTLVVKYNKKQVELPESIKQCVTIETNINIEAKNSNFAGGLANYNISQTANYTQLFDFMKLLCNNTFNVKELQPLLFELQKIIPEKRPIEEKWYKKFFKFMGTQLLDIAKQFLSAYTAVLLTK